MPPYYKQQTTYTCSLAVLRSVLASKNIMVTENELVSKVEPDYGKKFKNLWNPTLAKLARQYGIATHMYAKWPLFKPEILKRALAEYSLNPSAMNVSKYESPSDKDNLDEPLPLAYSDMFKAVKLGCKVTYGALTEKRLRKFLREGGLVQCSIKNAVLYPKGKDNYHSLLIYSIDGNKVTYHDPARGQALACDMNLLLKASTNTGAFIVFK